MLKRDLLFSAAICVVVGIPAFLFLKVWQQLYVYGADWNMTFFPATTALMHGLNPYEVRSLHNPVWTLLPLIPFAVFGSDFGNAAFFFASLFSFIFVAVRLKAKMFALFLFVLSPLILEALLCGNVEAIVVWGFILPAPISLFFLLIKPQVGIAVALYKVYIVWREEGLYRAALTVAPAGLALVLSFGLFGNWLVDHDGLLSATWSASLFPGSVPIGLLLIWLSFRKRKMSFSIPASPMLSPYLGINSWSVAMLGMLENNLLTFGVFVGTWTLFIMNAVMNTSR